MRRAQEDGPGGKEKIREGTNTAPLPMGVFQTEVEEKGCRKRSRQGKDAWRSRGRSKKTMEVQCIAK